VIEEGAFEKFKSDLAQSKEEYNKRFAKLQEQQKLHEQQRIKKLQDL
jgi:hypothetical protein